MPLNTQQVNDINGFSAPVINPRSLPVRLLPPWEIPEWSKPGFQNACTLKENVSRKVVSCPPAPAAPSKIRKRQLLSYPRAGTAQTPRTPSPVPIPNAASLLNCRTSTTRPGSIFSGQGRGKPLIISSLFPSIFVYAPGQG